VGHHVTTVDAMYETAGMRLVMLLVGIAVCAENLLVSCCGEMGKNSGCRGTVGWARRVC
jgi:hypothetical protein